MGKMNSFQMINHCNNFIEGGKPKISLRTRLFGDFLKSIFEIFKVIGFDITSIQKIQKPKRFKS